MPQPAFDPLHAAEMAFVAPAAARGEQERTPLGEGVLDEADGGSIRTVQNHYVRLKVFTDRGKESESQIDIAYFGRNKIDEIAGRTIKPDGTIVDLKPDAVFDRTIVKAGGVKVKAKSFAVPAVEPGAIIEYRWRETKHDHLANYVRLPFQRDIRAEKVTYHLKPLNVESLVRAVAMHLGGRSRR